MLLQKKPCWETNSKQIAWTPIYPKFESFQPAWLYTLQPAWLYTLICSNQIPSKLSHLFSFLHSHDIQCFNFETLCTSIIQLIDDRILGTTVQETKYPGRMIRAWEENMQMGEYSVILMKGSCYLRLSIVNPWHFFILVVKQAVLGPLGHWRFDWQHPYPTQEPIACHLHLWVRPPVLALQPIHQMVWIFQSHTLSLVHCQSPTGRKQ